MCKAMRVARYTRAVSHILVIGVTSLFPVYFTAQTCYNVAIKDNTFRYKR